MPRSRSGISKVAAAVIAVIVIIALIIGVYYATLPAGPTPTPATPTPTPKTPTPTTPTPATPTPTPATPTPTPKTPTPTTPTPTPTTPTPTPATPTPTPATPTPATPTPTPGPEKIKVGMIASLTGKYASAGRIQRTIAEEAVKMINGEGGIYLKAYGRKLPIDLILYDDQSDPQRGSELAIKLIADELVPLMVCCSYTMISNAVCKVAERYSTPILNAATPVEFFRAAGPWNYSWGHSQCFERLYEGLLAFVREYRGQTNLIFGFTASDDTSGRTDQQLLIPRIQREGYTVFNAGLYPPDASDYASIIMKLKIANCDILWFGGGIANFAVFWRQCNLLGYKPKILYTGAVARREDMQTLGADLSVGIVTHLTWHPSYPFPLSNAYKELWEKYLAQGFDLSPLGAYYFTLWFILKDAIERAGTLDRQAINKAISETNMMGACGPVSYDLKTHTSSGYMSLGQWMKTADGQMVLQPIWSEVAEVKVVKPIFPLP